MAEASRLSRLLWFVGLWAAGVLVVAVAAYGLRALLSAM
jgi:hypothetical protein